MRYFFLFLSILLFTAACSSGDNYGAGVDPKVPLIKVKDVHFDKTLLGKVVNLEGKIISQCQSPDKCWYFMQDETGQILVNLKPANFTLPAAINKQAKVTGTIQGSKDGYQIIAQGVKVF